MKDTTVLKQEADVFKKIFKKYKSNKSNFLIQRTMKMIIFIRHFIKTDISLHSQYT